MKMTWVYFLKIKNHKETLASFHTFKAIAEKSSEYSIHHFYCDKGYAKYDNEYFTDFLAKVGISYEPSAPYTQNQIGVSERKI